MSYLPLYTTRVTKDTYVPPGAFFMRNIDGWTGRWVSGVQAFVRGSSHYTHAGLVLDNDEIIEAAPGGARILPFDSLIKSDSLFVSDAPMQKWLRETKFPLSLGAKEAAEYTKRAEIAGKGRVLEGVPYSFLDYLALAMAEWKVPGWKMVRDRVESSEHLICSALVDRAYLWCDIHLFDDGRLPGDVTPWDLENYVMNAEGDSLSRLMDE